MYPVEILENLWRTFGAYHVLLLKQKKKKMSRNHFYEPWYSKGIDLSKKERQSLFKNK